MLNKNSFDVVGIGFGPANIALAIYLREINADLDIMFLEKATGPRWHTNMCYPNSDIQNHPLRDMVTPRNPRSKYTFINFLVEKERLFEHLNIGLKFPSRTEYEQYVKWVADDFAEVVRYNSTVESIERVMSKYGGFYNLKLAGGTVIQANKVIIAPGRTPYMPAVFAKCGPQVVHLNDYLATLNMLFADRVPESIAVVGGSQSAVEIILDLSRRYPKCKIDGIHRNFGYRQKDVGPFTGRVFFPEFVETFYHASPDRKRRLTNHLRCTNYSAADLDVLEALYEQLYYQKITHTQTICVYDETDVDACRETSERVILEMSNPSSGKFSNDYDLVILATGFRDLGPGESQEPYPAILGPVKNELALDTQGVMQVRYDYSVVMNDEEMGTCTPTLYLNGLCETSHGMGDAGSFSLLALRSKVIGQSLLGVNMMSQQPAQRTGTVG